MPQKTAIVASKAGLHARPAAIFMEAVNSSGLEVFIARPNEDPVDAGSILGLMSLGAARGDRVVLSAEGPEAEEKLAELVRLLETELDD